MYTPSAYLRELVIDWGVSAERVTVLPNPAPSELPAEPTADLRRRFGFEGPMLVFAGRLTAQKALGVLLDAVADCPGVGLTIVGDGGEQEAVEAGVVRGA